MINFSQLTEAQIILFALIFLRMTAFVFSAAIYSSETISVPLKILFSIVLTLVVYPIMAQSPQLVRVSELGDMLLLISIRELCIGLALGFLTRLFFFAISMAGELISISLGLGQAQIYNPMMGAQVNVVEQFYLVMGTLVYLMLNGHHVLLEGIVQSFSTAPVAVWSFSFGTLSEVVLKAQEFFVFGIKISAPILLSMLIVQIGVALLSRTVPQINVIMTSASITSFLGIIIIFISLPLLVMQMFGLLDLTAIEFFKFIKAV